MKKDILNKIIEEIMKEHIEYTGSYNLASYGIDSIDKALKYGEKVGIEITKLDCINIIKKHL